MKLSIPTINKAIKKLGGDAELVKGEGYFYFTSPKVMWDTHSVYVCKINHLDLEYWMEEYKLFVELGKAAELRYNSITPLNYTIKDSK